MKGLIHIYTGDGKGKTTAAAGLAIRAAGRGHKVIFVQFLKGGESGEINILQNLTNVTVLRNTREYGFYQALPYDERDCVLRENNENLKAAINSIYDGEPSLLVLDEIMSAYRLEAISRELVDALLENKPDSLELVLTGRNPDERFIALADYVSEIHKIKHPFDKGVQARKGVEF